MKKHLHLKIRPLFRQFCTNHQFYAGLRERNIKLCFVAHFLQLVSMLPLTLAWRCTGTVNMFSDPVCDYINFKGSIEQLIFVTALVNSTCINATFSRVSIIFFFPKSTRSMFHLTNALSERTQKILEQIICRPVCACLYYNTNSWNYVLKKSINEYKQASLQQHPSNTSFYFILP